MTTKLAKEEGRKHAEAGKQCTPFDCREFDAIIMAESKKQERPAKFYAKMRGAFNTGWQERYFEMVSA